MPEQNRNAELIRCLEEVENSVSAFLKKKEKNGNLLMENVKRMYSDPETAIANLREAFCDVVDPVLLQYFSGTWMAFLLWNDFTKQPQVLYNYPKRDPGTDIDPWQYDFVSGFINSPQFQHSKFTEPMTDIIFTEKSTVKQVMIFSWAQLPEDGELAKITSIPENIRPIIIPFNELGGKWTTEIEEIETFVQGHSEELDRDQSFATLASLISKLSDSILEDERVGPDEKKILSKARTQIYQEFNLSDDGLHPELLAPVALCRSLIWNRLFDKTWRYLYYIPARFLHGLAVSGIVCAFKDLLEPREYIVLTQIVNRIFSLFHFGFYAQQLNLFALRSATAAIMARNKSHIHGSHIEHGLRNKMEDFSAVIEDRLMSNQDFYRSLREKLGILDDSTPEKALEVRINFIEEIGKKLADAESFDAKICELENNRRDLSFLEDVSEQLERLKMKETGS